MRKLTEDAARDDLTDREIAKILGGLVGSLVQMAEVEDVRNAFRWWAQSDEAWTMFYQAESAGKAILEKYGEDVLNKAYDDGRKAKKDGRPLSDNPYQDPVLVNYWNSGYGIGGANA